MRESYQKAIELKDSEVRRVQNLLREEVAKRVAVAKSVKLLQSQLGAGMALAVHLMLVINGDGV